MEALPENPTTHAVLDEIAIQRLSDAKLVTLPECPKKETEIERRLALTPIANRLAYQVLTLWSEERTGCLSAKEATAVASALDGLRGCCYRARRNLFAPVQAGDAQHEATRRFFEDRILALLTPFVGKPKCHLESLALQKRFKNIPREICFDLVDRIRKQYSQKATLLTFIALEDPDCVEDGRLDDRQWGSDGEPDAEFKVGDPGKLLTLRQSELMKLLGPDDYISLTAVCEHMYQADNSDSKQGRKSGLTQAIAKRHGVRFRRATELKKSLHNKMTQALKDQNPLILRMYSLLLGPVKPSFGPAKRSLHEDKDDAAQMERHLRNDDWDKDLTKLLATCLREK